MMRMPWHKELRWLLASYLAGWALDLTKREASKETLQAFSVLFENFGNDRRHDTVKMRRA